MSRVGFEPTVSAGERPKTYALDRAATGIGGLWNVEKMLCSRTDHRQQYTYNTTHALYVLDNWKLQNLIQNM